MFRRPPPTPPTPLTGTPTRRWAALAATVTSVMVGLGGVTAVATAAPAAAATTTLTLYNAQHEQTTDALIKAFTASTGIKVRTDNDDEDVLTAQIEAEGSRSPADLFFTENSNWLQQLDDKGLLSRVTSTTLANVPGVDRAANGAWVGVSARVAALVYDPARVKASQLPTSVLGLANPKWKGKIEIAPAETDFWPVIVSVAHRDGRAATLTWLEGLAANAGSNAAVPDNETLTSDVNAGTTDLALINHYYYYRLRSELGKAKVSARLAYLAPRDPGYVEGISGLAVLKSSEHQAAAQKFLAFVTGTAGQRVLARSDSFEYPIHPGVAAASGMTPLAKLSPNGFTPAELGTGLEAKTLLQEAGLL